MKRSVVYSIALLFIVSTVSIESCRKPKKLCEQSDVTALDISPIQQQRPMWCWITCGEMIFRYFGVNANNPYSYQCGIIGTINPYACYYNCDNCSWDGGQDYEITNMFWLYPMYQNDPTLANPDTTQHIYSTLRYSALSEDEVRAEIDAGRPIFAGVSPGETNKITPSHAVLIIGYFNNEDGDFCLIVNDPWPYESMLPDLKRNPYKKARGCNETTGQYRVPYEQFKKKFSWATTFYGFHE